MDHIGTLVDISTIAVSGTEYQLAKSLASDLLQGCYSDYLFFCKGSETSNNQVISSYLLLVGDLSRNNQNYYISENCRVFQISVIRQLSDSVSDLDFSGVTVDLNTSPLSRFSGSGSVTSDNFIYYTVYDTYELPVVMVSSQVSTVFYSNLENHPHLIEGVQNYAFLGVCLFVAVCVFKLSDRIFRRVY